KSENKWLEIVVLLIPTHNDSPEEIQDLCGWVMDNLGPDVPMHFTRFHPTYRLKDVPPTPPSTLEKAREIGMAKGLHYVYAGNVPGNPGENTYCPKCKALLIERKGFFIISNTLVGGKCPKCSEPIPGVWA
ncbi:MAG TPA: radical SAM protein, partial [bacterium]|nr:radical SAM protein [bacterium]